MNRKGTRNALPNKYVMARVVRKIRKQEKNMCVANAITMMNEFSCGHELYVEDCYTKKMSRNGERLFVVADKINNYGQQIVSSNPKKRSRRLQFNIVGLKKPYVENIKKAISSNKSVVVTITSYNHNNVLQSYRDINGTKNKLKLRPHAICIYGYHDGIGDKEIHPLEKGYFNFINSHGQWIDGSNGVGILTYEYAEKYIEEGVVTV